VQRSCPMQEVYARRQPRTFAGKLYSAIQPPVLFIHNPGEPLHFPLGRWNLYIGGGGSDPEGYVNLDLFALPGVDVAADAERLPFPSSLFECVECDAVLEHTRRPDQVVREIARVLAPGGYAHIVTPFCHPFHQFPRDYWRFTLDGLKQVAGCEFEVVAEGWRTGPTATVLLFLLEYVKLWLPWRLWRVLAHGILGWLLFPLRYLDLLFFRLPPSAVIGNHCYLWLRKRSVDAGQNWAGTRKPTVG
jgi:SAM-dependent methyltransferase